MDILERVRILEAKELRRKEHVIKSKKRPEYKEHVKEYNKRYYLLKKEKESHLKEAPLTN